MDPITSLASSSLFGQVEAAQSPRAVSAAEEQRFRQALEPADESTIVATEIAANGEGVGAKVSTQSLGGAFMEGIEEIKTSLEARADRITEQLTALAGNPMSLQDAMRMQYELMQMNMQQELTSKMADKTSQGVQMLFRNQG